jgi:hypothetical protein
LAETFEAAAGPSATDSPGRARTLAPTAARAPPLDDPSRKNTVMPARDPELQSFPYRIDLIAFATQAGYEVRARESDHSITLLEHPNRDRIVVARCPDGAWIYASANRYDPRGADETPAEAARRLRDCIARTKDKGTIVDFVQARDWTARTQAVSLECARERLRDYVREGVPLHFHGALCPPTGLTERPQRTANALDARRVGLASVREQARDGDSAAPQRTFVITASPAHAALYYEQHGQRFGHTNATAMYTSVGPERPGGAGRDFRGIDKAMAALPAGTTVVAALPAPPAGDRLARELSALAARHPQVRFERHTVRIERDKNLGAPDRHPLRALPSHALSPSRGR